MSRVSVRRLCNNEEFSRKHLDCLHNILHAIINSEFFLNSEHVSFSKADIVLRSLAVRTWLLRSKETT